jgi:hypothetical protein
MPKPGKSHKCETTHDHQSIGEVKKAILYGTAHATK